MAATNTTPNLELSQFVGSDKPDWLTDYNGDMSKIDSSYGAVDALAQAANSAAEAAAASATQAAADAASALSGISGAIDAATAATAAAEQATSVANSALSVANGAASTAQSAAADAQQALAVANNAKVTAENAQAAAAQAVTDAAASASAASTAQAAATQAATDAAAAAAIAQTVDATAQLALSTAQAAVGAIEYDADNTLSPESNETWANFIKRFFTTKVDFNKLTTRSCLLLEKHTGGTVAETVILHIGRIYNGGVCFTSFPYNTAINLGIYSITYNAAQSAAYFVEATLSSSIQISAYDSMIASTDNKLAIIY